MATATKKMKKGTSEDLPDNPTRFLNIKKISTLTRIDKDKIYNNLKDKYNTLTPGERKQIATVLMVPLDLIFKKLGMQISFARYTPPDNGDSKTGTAAKKSA